MGEPFLGEIRLFPFGFAPRGWMPCEGQLLPINRNQAVFALLGTTYGGDGQTNFALPNLKGRSPIHPSQTFPQGSSVGSNTTTLTNSQMAMHTHQFSASNATANSGATADNALASPQADQIYGTPTQMTGLTNSVTSAGQGLPYDNHQPYLVLYYCIALVGIFPSRS